MSQRFGSGKQGTPPGVFLGPLVEVSGGLRGEAQFSTGIFILGEFLPDIK